MEIRMRYVRGHVEVYDARGTFLFSADSEAEAVRMLEDYGLNIQIFGRSKCFDTKKAERWFKERRIKFQSIDLVKYGMSGGEFDSVLRAVGGIDNLIDWSVKDPEIDLMRYMDDRRAKEDKVFDQPKLIKTPVVRNGKQATVGYRPDVWETWE